MIKTLAVIRPKLNKSDKNCLLTHNTLYLERLLLVFVWLLICEVPLQAEEISQVHDWENPSVIEINKEKSHASIVLPSEKAGDFRVVSLNGQWHFKWSPDPESRPMEFYKQEYSVAQWDLIQVPGNWQMQGFGLPIVKATP